MDTRAFIPKFRPPGRDAFVRRFGIDTRALAALRISLGLLLLADLTIRSRNLVAFYTDSGVLPRAVLFEQYPGLAQVSLHAISGAAWVQVALFLLAGGFAVALLFGYRTTLATAGSFVLLLSLHARNPILLSAGDSILRRLLFWGLFLPLGERWSVDASRNEEPRRRVTSIATAALLIQVVLVYTVNAAFKLRGDVWLRGDAIRYVFSLDQLTVLFGDTLAQYPALLKFSSMVWLVMVASSVLLILLTGRSRATFAFLFIAMHAGMILTLHLGLFPFISIASLIPFIPGGVWNAITVRLSGPVGRFRGSTGRLSRFERRLPSTVGPAVPPAVAQWKQRLLPVVVAGFLAFVLFWNGASLGYVDAPDGVTSVVDPAEHRWDMFSKPRQADGWYVVPGELESGEQVDAFRQSSIQWDKPPDVTKTYPSHRWFVYLMDLRRPGYADFRENFGEYLCQRWNDDHEDDLVEFTVYYVEQPTRFDGQTASTRRIELLSHSCSAPGSSGS